MVSLVLTRLDFGNSVLAGLPVYLLRRLQSELNARLTYRLRDHITDASVCLHWLRMPERVQFKIAVLAYSPARTGRAYFKRGVQPKCVVQKGKRGVQNLEMWSPNLQCVFAFGV